MITTQKSPDQWRNDHREAHARFLRSEPPRERARSNKAHEFEQAVRQRGDDAAKAARVQGVKRTAWHR